MAQLRNTRWEHFARNIAKGMSIVDSYQLAGYKTRNYHSAADSGSKLLKKPEIQERVDEIRRLGAARAEITVAKVVEELAAIGFANMSNYVTVTEDGRAVIDLSTLTPFQASAIHSVKSEMKFAGKRPKGWKEGDDPDQWEIPPEYSNEIKLHPKIPALVKLGEHVGAFSGDGDKQQPVQFFFSDKPISEDEWSKRFGDGAAVPPADGDDPDDDS